MLIVLGALFSLPVCDRLGGGERPLQLHTAGLGFANCNAHLLVQLTFIIAQIVYQVHTRLRSDDVAYDQTSPFDVIPVPRDGIGPVAMDAAVPSSGRWS